MPLRDFLLQMTSYPEPTPRWALDEALAVADRFDARLSVALCQVHVPNVSNWLADKLVQASGAIAVENAKSRGNARRLLSQFASVAPEHRRGGETLIDCNWLVTPRELSRRARLHDMTIIPVGEGLDGAYLAEGVVFDSGRPVLLLPEASQAPYKFAHVVIGWDGSRAAARAVADAIPVCTAAEQVRILQVTGETKLAAGCSAADLKLHLARHGIDAATEEVAANGLDAGTALLDACIDIGADALVMGAFGHLRAREFVLGGATRSVLASVRLPVVLSH